jgi:hypothetical protein
VDAKTLARLRPADDSARAIRIAIDAVKHERTTAEQRMVDYAARRTDLLLNGSTAEIRAAEEAIRDAETDLARLDAISPALSSQLAEAVAREAGDAQAEQVRASVAKIERFNSWFAESYAKHAAALAEGLELEREAERARTALRNTTVALPTGLPEMARAFVGSQARGLGFLVRLPAAAPAQQPFWWPR